MCSTSQPLDLVTQDVNQFAYGPRTASPGPFQSPGRSGRYPGQGHRGRPVKAPGRGSQFENAGAYLIAVAVVAYCPTYFPSNVRKALTDHIAIPDEFADTHRLVGAFRNTTITHSSRPSMRDDSH